MFDPAPAPLVRAGDPAVPCISTGASRAPVTLGVRGLVIDGKGRVFLVKHSYVDGWHLPGGGVETGETHAAALARELRKRATSSSTARRSCTAIYFNARVSRRDHVALFIVRDFRQDNGAGAEPRNRRARLLCARRAARRHRPRHPRAHRRGVQGRVGERDVVRCVARVRDTIHPRRSRSTPSPQCVAGESGAPSTRSRRRRWARTARSQAARRCARLPRRRRRAHARTGRRRNS